MMIPDFHTHTLRPDAIVDIDPSVDAAISLSAPYFYSVGIHPWNAERANETLLQQLHTLASHPRVVAIGETGLDLVHHGPQSNDTTLQGQTDLLKYHTELSETTGKPLILHIVRQFNEIIRLKAAWRPSQPWIIHGFRGKPQLARELVRHGFYISIGEHFNQASLAEIPPERLLLETDDSDLSIHNIARLAGVTDVAPAMKSIALKSGEFGAFYSRMSEES